MLRLVTCMALPEVDVDRAPLEAALQRAGISFAWQAWDDPGVDWTSSHPTLLRTPWNYSQRLAAFVPWLQQVAANAPLQNPWPLVAANLHKGYLLALAEAGVPIVPTTLVPAPAEAVAPFAVSVIECWQRHALPHLGTTECIQQMSGGGGVVIKPAIGAGSLGTRAFAADALDAAGSYLATSHRQRDMLVQPMIETVPTEGEVSIILIGGEVSHAVRKRMRLEGEQEAVEGPVPIPAEAAALARRALQAFVAHVASASSFDTSSHTSGLAANRSHPTAGMSLAAPPAYARVDLMRAPWPVDAVRGAAPAPAATTAAPAANVVSGLTSTAPSSTAPWGDWLVSELELIEPSLFFEMAPGSAELFVAAIQRRWGN